MKKNAFTLVELLAVLIVLGLIAVIVVPSVTNTVKSSNENAYKKQIQVLETAAEKWGTENIDRLPAIDSDETLVIDFNTLYTSGQIATYPVNNPKTNSDLEGCIIVTYNNTYKQYEYKYNSDTTKCSN